MLKQTAKQLAIATTAAIALSAGVASAQQACSNYTVADGDTLATIAIAAYGTSNYQPIFNANRSGITNPNALEPGLVLALPCEDGSLPDGRSAQEIIAAEESRFAQTKRSSTYEPPIKLVTGNGWAPFADESLNGGGFITRLGTTALQRGGNARDFSVSFVDDWNSHLDVLLPLGAFDVSMAWVQPDCTNRTYEWSKETEVRCTQFDASVPVYDTVFGVYSLPDSSYAGATSYEQLKGSTVCRMTGWGLADLEGAGLQAPETITLLQPVTARECVDAVLNGTADVATFEVQLMSDTLSEMGLTANDVVENPFVSTVQSLRFIVHRSNPFGRQYLSMLNKGLNEMRESGEWYAVVSDTLREHNEKLMAASN
ncbi:amino acid ABC transporter substrate-binding protein, PAAT family [Aliiroseovarius halocynthiae]|uniref:Transporter substrate-binding domain-containing protein n=1 Tax=Aliiroseovarius halocynthiae TaxID=985055 RepID=A0A545SPE1_9RHOB|nr:transporter substrate-binding domain-containing protein [Aliiroseovarius halocynthiae]TQV66839.1 transporter substrate-binding domain-containing protein [Aliiroseovarius halocynthiae]SMR82324.1 amino acid ABC transporter substrate-binding protein, PAAT family [Aliiroseovarius halocynthiae]